MIAWVFFRAASLDDALYVLRNMLNLSASADITAPFAAGVLGMGREFGLSIGLIVLLLAVDWLDLRQGLLKTLAEQRTAVRWAVYYGCGALILLALVYGTSTQEFIYFQF
jgi:hypothetical protein